MHGAIPAAARKERQPVAQDVRQFFKERYDQIGVRPTRDDWSDDIKIRAEPEWARLREDGKTGYRIRIWLESRSALGHV